MACESCEQRPVTIEEDCGDGEVFLLCTECHERLTNYALRPLEFFRLYLRHGPYYYLHDDFYDEETGEAYQPEVDVEEPERYPFPALDTIVSDPHTLLGYALVKFTIDDALLAAMQKLPKGDVLDFIQDAAGRSTVFALGAYQIAADVLGPFAAEWIRSEWHKMGEDEGCYGIVEAMARCLPPEEGFELVSRKIAAGSDAYFKKNSGALIDFRTERTLDWLETMADRIAPVVDSWGRLAAMSQFSWQRAQDWLHKGRPLSLMALDALWLCTAPEESLVGQGPFIKQNPPQLSDAPDPAALLEELKAYLAKDAVPRTEGTVGAIRANLSPKR